MGLFDNISEDIKEIFTEYSLEGNSDKVYKNYINSVINEIGGTTSNNPNCSEYYNSNSVLKFNNGTFIATSDRYKSFYKRLGQISTAYELLKSGNHSAREVSRICKMGINTVCKLLKSDSNLKCICGKLLSEHRGWCKYRFSKSKKRQLWMLSMQGK